MVLLHQLRGSMPQVRSHSQFSIWYFYTSFVGQCLKSGVVPNFFIWYFYISFVGQRLKSGVVPNFSSGTSTPTPASPTVWAKKRALNLKADLLLLVEFVVQRLKSGVVPNFSSGTSTPASPTGEETSPYPLRFQSRPLTSRRVRGSTPQGRSHSQVASGTSTPAPVLSSSNCHTI